MIKKRKDKGHGPELLIYIIPLALIAGAIIGAIGSCRERFINKQAEIHASYRYGDKEPPLTDGEKKEWYASMGWDSEPSYRQVKDFVSKCERR